MSLSTAFLSDRITTLFRARQMIRPVRADVEKTCIYLGLMLIGLIAWRFAQCRYPPRASALA